MQRRHLIRDQIRQIEDARLERIGRAPSDGPHAMVRLLARVIGIGIETADMLVQEVLSRTLRDRRAVARYAGSLARPTSGKKRREGLARFSNTRVRRGMIQLAWRFLMFRRTAPWREPPEERPGMHHDRGWRKLIIACGAWSTGEVRLARIAGGMRREPGQDKLSEPDEQNIVSVR
jgi:transposase